MVIWLITDVAVVVQLPDAFVVSRYRCDLAMRHQLPPGDGKRAGEIVALPLDKECRKQTDMRSH